MTREEVVDYCNYRIKMGTHYQPFDAEMVQKHIKHFKGEDIPVDEIMGAMKNRAAVNLPRQMDGMLTHLINTFGIKTETMSAFGSINFNLGHPFAGEIVTRYY